LWRLAAWEVSMANLHETSNQQHKTQIDIETVGWLFAAFVVVITAIAAMVAYEGNNTMVAKITVSHVAAPPS
jgi:Na+/melibiose symporter-like transporter